MANYAALQQLSGRLQNFDDHELVTGGYQALQDLGLIRSRRDLVSLGKAMQISPTEFPRGPIDEPQVRDWLRAMRDFEWTAGVDMTPHRVEQPPDVVYCDEQVILGLSEETATANAARQPDTTTIALTRPLRNVTLWFDTDNGQVDKITEIKVDDVPLVLGPGDYLPALAADMGTEPHPMRTGIRIAYVEREIYVAVSIKPSAEDVVWRTCCTAEVVKRADKVPRLYAVRA